MDKDILNWLLKGDASIQYQTRRDLVGEDDPALRARIASEGWGARLLARRNSDGSWAQGFYQPKWTSSHYTLLELRTFEMPPDNALVRQSIHKITLEEKVRDGGIGPASSVGTSDICIDGMFSSTMPAISASPKTACARSSISLSTSAWKTADSTAAETGRERRTARCIRRCRCWRGFAHTRRAATGTDWRNWRTPPQRDGSSSLRIACSGRTGPARSSIPPCCGSFSRRVLPAAHPGQVHFVMEKAGQPSRWVALLALRVLKAYPRA